MDNFYDQGAPMPEPEVIKTIGQVESFFEKNSGTYGFYEVNDPKGIKILD